MSDRDETLRIVDARTLQTAKIYIVPDNMRNMRVSSFLQFVIANVADEEIVIDMLMKETMQVMWRFVLTIPLSTVPTDLLVIPGTSFASHTSLNLRTWWVPMPDVFLSGGDIIRVSSPTGLLGFTSLVLAPRDFDF